MEFNPLILQALTLVLTVGVAYGVVKSQISQLIAQDRRVEEELKKIVDQLRELKDSFHSTQLSYLEKFATREELRELHDEVIRASDKAEAAFEKARYYAEEEAWRAKRSS